jgi:hypothetical protein
MSTQLHITELPAQLLRRRCWRVVLLLEQVDIPLCALAQRLLEDPGRPLVALRALHQTGERVRRIHHASHLRAHESAREAASAALADADLDDRLLDHVVATLANHQLGDPEPLAAWIDTSNVDPQLLAAYANAVQATHRALWIARQEAT